MNRMKLFHKIHSALLAKVKLIGYNYDSQNLKSHFVKKNLFYTIRPDMIFLIFQNQLGFVTGKMPRLADAPTLTDSDPQIQNLAKTYGVPLLNAGKIYDRENSDFKEKHIISDYLEPRASGIRDGLRILNITKKSNQSMLSQVTYTLGGIFQKCFYEVSLTPDQLSAHQTWIEKTKIDLEKGLWVQEEQTTLKKEIQDYIIKMESDLTNPKISDFAKKIFKDLLEKYLNTTLQIYITNFDDPEISQLKKKSHEFLSTLKF